MTWLADHGFKPEFHDFKKKGITKEKLDLWCDTFGWENVLNKKGTTWRKLTPEEQGEVINQETAVVVLLKHTSAIKRPIVEVEGQPALISFSEELYKNILIK